MATQPPRMSIDDSLRADLLSLRRDLHRHPELSFEEHQTAARLEAALKAGGLEQIQRVATTGVTALVKGKDSGAPTVCIRGDIDALPIQEATGLDYASENDGVMHACGHDVHATWTVGAARLLQTNPPPGDVLVLLQPAEETGRGASAVIESGALDNVAAVFGGHVDRRFEVGQVVAQSGPLAASADMFRLTLTGNGAHGARPHEANDPIVGAAALISALQSIVSRRLNPADAGVVTVGSVHAGTAPNVIPDVVELSGTLRAVTPEVREMLHAEVARIVDHIAQAHHIMADLRLEHGTPPIINEELPTGWARQAVSEVLGEEALTPLGFLNMGGEDFAFYLEKMPGCFVRIGARLQGEAPTPAHTPQFYAADESIFVGASVLAETARHASTALAKG